LPPSIFEYLPFFVVQTGNVAQNLDTFLVQPPGSSQWKAVMASATATASGGIVV